MSKLIVTEDGRERTVEITQAEIEIGRSSDNQVVISDPRSSRKHCRLRRTPQGWVLEDLKSRNGTLLNGAPLEKNFLSPGDEFAIGKTKIRFIEEAGEAGPSKTVLAEGTAPLPPSGIAAKITSTVRGIPAPLEDQGRLEGCFLEGTEGPFFGQRIPIAKLPFTIGRKKENDFALNDPRASGSHARIFLREKRLILEDLGSRNGTLLNHKRIREGVLTQDSTIRIGDCLFRVELPKALAESALRRGAAEDWDDNPEAAAPAAVEDDFGRFDARRFLKEGERSGVPLSLVAILLVLGTFLYFALDVTMKTIRSGDPDPPEEGNLLANPSFEARSETPGIPGWTVPEGSSATIALSAEGAQFPGRSALRLIPKGPGLSMASTAQDYPIDPEAQYRVAAHVVNQGAFAAGVAVTWLIDAGGGRVEAGRNWGAVLREDVKADDLDRIVTPPSTAVFARICPFLIQAGEGASGGSPGGGAVFDRIFFGKKAYEGSESEEVPEKQAGSPDEGMEGESEPELPAEISSGDQESGIPGAASPSLPIRIQVSAEGILRNLRRGSRTVVQALWAGLPQESDPYAMGPRLMTRAKEVTEREGVLFVAQLPELTGGRWFPLEGRVNGQAGEIRCEFRFGQSRSGDSAAADRAVLYIDPSPAVREIMAFGGKEKGVSKFPPASPPDWTVDELQFGSDAEQIAILFQPPVRLRAIPSPDVKGTALLAAEVQLAGDPGNRGAAKTSRSLSIRFSPTSQREDEAAAALLSAAAQLHRDGKPADARLQLEELRRRYPWRKVEIARADELVKGWNEEAARSLKEIQEGIRDLEASPSPVIREALAARIAKALERFDETPSQAGLKAALADVERRAPAKTPSTASAVLPVLSEARTHLNQGRIGLADLFLRLARETKLSQEEEEDARHLKDLIAERRKQQASEEVR